MSKQASRRRRAVVLGALLRLLSALFGLLPWRLAQACGRGLGRLVYRLVRRDRRRALDHLRLAFPELDETERRRLARASFLHLGANLAECLHLRGKSRRAILRRVRPEGHEELVRLRQTGRPVLMLTGHCGNWELLGAAFGCLDLPLSAVVRRLDEPRLHAALEDLRASFGTETIDRGTPGSAKKLLRALRQGRTLMMLIDQDTRVEGVWVPFFGHPAFTPIGAARLALKVGAAVLPVFDERLSDGTHRVRFSPPLELPDDPVEATAAMTRVIEEQIRRRPEQWVWMHRRWRRRPPGGEGAGAV